MFPLTSFPAAVMITEPKISRSFFHASGLRHGRGLRNRDQPLSPSGQHPFRYRCASATLWCRLDRINSRARRLREITSSVIPWWLGTRDVPHDDQITDEIIAAFLCESIFLRLHRQKIELEIMHQRNSNTCLDLPSPTSDRSVITPGCVLRRERDGENETETDEGERQRSAGRDIEETRLRLTWALTRQDIQAAGDSWRGTRVQVRHSQRQVRSAWLAGTICCCCCCSRRIYPTRTSTTTTSTTATISRSSGALALPAPRHREHRWTAVSLEIRCDAAQTCPLKFRSVKL